MCLKKVKQAKLGHGGQKDQYGNDQNVQGPCRVSKVIPIQVQIRHYKDFADFHAQPHAHNNDCAGHKYGH